MSELPIVVDFETEAIQPRPHYPPRPVGVAIRYPEAEEATYLAFGHPEENNCDFNHAAQELKSIWDSGRPVLFHNAKFDLEVALEHFGLPILPWNRVHDTMFLLFLDNPHAKTFALKPAAESYLGQPPEERDHVLDWLVAHKECRRNEKGWGGKICKAPGNLVGRYAIGDVQRTLDLYTLLHTKINSLGMGRAYDRERQLLPILLANERAGMRVDGFRLLLDVEVYSEALRKSENWLRKRLGVADLNLDADAQLAEALDRSGVVSEWETTKTGQKSVAKGSLTPDLFTDPQVASILGYRNRLQTCLSTFMLPWLETARATGGRIHTSWNQVRQVGGATGLSGARTGRLSGSPNFMNLPKNWSDKDDGYTHPAFLEDLPELPLVRRYVLPDADEELFAHRDFSQQELRILAHFEDGLLAEGYRADPNMDIHTFVQTRLAEDFGITVDRRPVKILNFGLIYGMGLDKLANGMRVSRDEAQRIKDAQRSAIPGLGQLEKAIKARGRRGDPIRTWGGRLYYVEPPQTVDGELRTFEYKLLNYLIQGSAADCTKQALINYDQARKHGRLLVTVHDEINISVPKEHLDSEMKILRESMADVAFDVPMLSDGKFGPNWAETEKYRGD